MNKSITHDIERGVVRKVIDALRDAGFILHFSPENADDMFWPIDDSTDRTLDEFYIGSSDDTLYANKEITPGKWVKGWVQFVYGNGLEVISDYSTNLKDLMDPLDEYCHQIEH